MTAKTFLQAGNTAGMHKTYGNVPGAGMLHGLAPGFMRNFVGEHDDGIRRTDLVFKIAFVTMNALEGRPSLPSRRDIFFLQSVHATD